MLRPVLGSLTAVVLASVAHGETMPVEKGTVRFTPGDEKNTPACYRLPARTFAWEMSLKFAMPECGIDVFRLRFPSPMTSPHPENNTVHAEYYRPRKKGPVPGVIVLDITGGDQSLSRAIATHLAQNGIAGLFVQMAYYGPRRPANSKVRLLSVNLPQTVEAVRQTVLDLRRAGAWLGSRPEIDAARLGIMGTSLGSLVGTLAAEMEPRFRRVGVLLGGGGLVDTFWDDPRARPYRNAYELLGGTKDKVVAFFAPLDPLTCAGNLKDRKLLIMAGKRDEILPPRMAQALWKASGEQKLVWFDCTHYGAVLYLATGLEHLVAHFGAE